MKMKYCIPRIVILVIVISALPAQAWWGRYASFKEARTACEKWKTGAQTISYREQGYSEDKYREELFKARGGDKPLPHNGYIDRDLLAQSVARGAAHIEMTKQLSLRRCLRENTTRQFLGEEYKGKLSSEVYPKKPLLVAEEWKVVKHFRY